MTISAYNPNTKLFNDIGPPAIYGGDINQALADVKALITAGSGINVRGAWAASTAYAVGDVVIQAGSSYIAPAAFTSGSTFNASNWTLLASSGIPAASGQILGASGTAGQAVAIALGAGLAIQSGSLVCTVTGAGTYTLPAATTSALGGVKGDGQTVTIANDGTLSVNITAATALTDIATLGGPIGTDIGVLNRSGTDYKVTFTAQAALFRKTPAGSRTVTLATGSTTATLTAADHDKTVVVAGIAGTLAVDGTITDGFQCRVINHTGSALTYSGITGLQGATTLPNNATTVVTLSNATVEASAPAVSSGGTPGGSTGQIQYNNGGAFAGVTLGSGLALTSGTLSVTYSYTLPVASSTVLGGVKQGSGVTIAGDGTISVSGTGGVTTFNTRTGAIALTLGDVTAVTGTGATARTSLGLATVASSGAYSDLSGAPAIPAASSTTPAVDGTGAAGTSATYARSDHVHPTDTTRLAAASNLSDLANAATARANLGVLATFSPGVAGVVSSLPGGTGAVVLRVPFLRPCSLATNLATPYAPQGSIGTAPSATASFGLTKVAAGGTSTSIGSISISPTKVISATVTATSFAAGDALIVTAPSPADSTLADVALSFSGAWS